MHVLYTFQHFIPTDAYIKEREKEIVKYDNIWEIIHKGSYPELYDIDRDWQEYYSSYVATYLERDINELVAADSTLQPPKLLEG